MVVNNYQRKNYLQEKYQINNLHVYIQCFVVDSFSNQYKTRFWFYDGNIVHQYYDFMRFNTIPTFY